PSTVWFGFCRGEYGANHRESVALPDFVRLGVRRWRAFRALHLRGELLGGQVRGVLERQSLVAGQSLAFLVHLEGPFLQRRNNRGDLVEVQIGRDPRVTGALDHRAELSVLDLLEGPLQRIVDDCHVPIGPMVLVARTIMVMRALPET